jgi:N-acetylneuraminic acid mutarotase
VHAAERYDPARGRWSRAGTSSTAGIAAVLLNDGRVLVIGGTEAELYDPARNRWAPTGGMTAAHGGPPVVLQDGRVLVAGGGTGDVYSLGAGTWTATGPMVFPYASAAGALLPNGQVLYAGGIRSECQKFGGCEPLADAELYTP